MKPADLPMLGPDGGDFVAEMGVGVVHRDRPQPTHVPERAIVDLHQRILDAFDPTDRLNPGRSALRRA